MLSTLRLSIDGVIDNVYWCFGSRGITSRYRHLLEDVKRLCVHSKSEPKFEKKQRLQDLKEICELKSCNNCMYLECRKSEYCYLWMGCMPNGPTAKFQIHNVHTLGEMKLTGNCLHGSRPLLHFDAAFDDNTNSPQLALYKQMFIKMFGVPRNHPKSKPFYDHVMAFYWLDNKIWIRHYQISPEGAENMNNPDKQTLTEIGPRMVLQPIIVLSGSFSGDVIYRNIRYESPTEMRRQLKRARAVEHEAKVVEHEKSKMRKVAANLEEDDLDEIFGRTTATTEGNTTPSDDDDVEGEEEEED
ncbi:Ribosome bioproteinsis protein BRX1 [Perkinsus olseni]|uniref:Ribosome bioproteinsis protein BRX1 n=1 Tax=Perkinsus olseni TaxID=32597 RepID=A0A7J6NSY7_PEROL|nr:Ribosome bioproteinsis protein BRX1 [Perkinsus olseni]